MFPMFTLNISVLFDRKEVTYANQSDVHAPIILQKNEKEGIILLFTYHDLGKTFSFRTKSMDI
jgi:hypothetical protein